MRWKRILSHGLYLHMKNFLLLTILYLIPVSLFSQKISVRVIKFEKSTRSEWQILDDQYYPVFSGNENSGQDSVSFNLEANKPYIFQISVSEISNSDTNLYSLQIKDEPILMIRSEIGPGDHFFPFFTGMKITDAKITGGTNTLISEFPWQIFLLAGDAQCGGSIISNKWVVTAAHCTQNSLGNTLLPSEMSVKVGANNPYNTSEGKTYKVSEIIVHESFDSLTLKNDIALLRISDSINFPNAVPISLINSVDVANGATDPGVLSMVTGWGLTSVTPKVLPTILQKVQLPIISATQASTVWSDIPSTDLMAGYLNGNKDACNGDSGGPLAVLVSGEYKLAGIVSWGSQSCNTYGAYTRVSDFETWIKTKTGYNPPTPAGDSIICQGIESSLYSISNLPAASAYEWELLPVSAGVITGNSGNATVSWNLNYTGRVAVMVRVSISGTISNWSTLNVNVAKNTKILTQSKDTVLCDKQPVVLNASAEGYNLIYKWYKDGILVQSRTSGQLSFASASTYNSGDYLCTIAGSCGTLNSDKVNLTVLPLTAISYISPDVEASFGNNVILEVTSGGYNLTYQWQKNDVMLANSNTSQLVLQNVNASDIGLYQTTVTGACGIEKSDSIYVYVKTPNSASEPEVFLWPTITSNEFKVALSNDNYYTVKIYGTMGQLIKMQTNCQYQTIIDVNNLPRGVYIINVGSNNYMKSFKLIKV